MNIESVDLLVHMKDLIIEHYGSKPTIKELQEDLQLKGLTGIDRKTISKYIKKASA
jgi:hypothetical protein